MTDFRLVMLSDTHLSGSHPFFYHNWDVALEAANALTPDLAVVTGDLTLNGSKKPADLDFAAAQMKRFSAPVVQVLPGNHDVGYAPVGNHGKQKMTAARRKEYLARFCPDFWTCDHGTWRFIGLNPFLLESGLKAEVDQRDMVVEALTHQGPIGVFSHMPFFGWDPAENNEDTTATLRPAPRADLLRLFTSANVRFVATGHKHRHKRMIFESVDHIWAPGVAFMTGGPNADRWGGEPWVGFLDFQFTADGYTVTKVEPEDMLNIDIRNWARDGTPGYYRNVERPFRGPKY